ncbi:MAG: TIM barrel protein [Bacteroidales bacterium]|jgi:sugar phosphate isomerase/epimerase|nr:TIM barrel protein [Bacteroidales bacterium]
MQEGNIHFFELPINEYFTEYDAKLIIKSSNKDLNCYSIHMPKNISIGQVTKNLGLMKGLDYIRPKIIIIHPQIYCNFTKDCCELSRMIENHGSTLCIEYLAYDKLMQSIYESLPPKIGITLDFFHCTNANAPIEKAISFFNANILHVHLNDFFPGESALCPGEGNMHIEKYLTMLKKMNYEGKYIIECNLNNSGNFHRVIEFCNSLNTVLKF